MNRAIAADLEARMLILMLSISLKGHFYWINKSDVKIVLLFIILSIMKKTITIWDESNGSKDEQAIVTHRLKPKKR